MNLTGKQKGYAVVLAIALVSFCADRLFFLSADTKAVAGEDPRDLLVPSARGASASAARRPPQRSRYQVDALADRLADAAAEQNLQLSAVRDAFVPSAAWVSGPKEIIHDTAGEAAAAFRARHRLTAVFRGPSGATAIINGRSVKIGQRLGGFTLESIDHRSTTFVSAHGRVELSLDPEVTAVDVE